MMSHLVWVRGLKQYEIGITIRRDNVAPRVGAWIETSYPNIRRIDTLSHLVWVRGLKHTISVKELRI